MGHMKDVGGDGGVSSDLEEGRGVRLSVMRCEDLSGFLVSGQSVGGQGSFFESFRRLFGGLSSTVSG